MDAVSDKKREHWETVADLLGCGESPASGAAAPPERITDADLEQVKREREAVANMQAESDREWADLAAPPAGPGEPTLREAAEKVIAAWDEYVFSRPAPALAAINALRAALAGAASPSQNGQSDATEGSD